MPATIEIESINHTSESSPDRNRRDSAFTYDSAPSSSSEQDMDRLRAHVLSQSSEHIRRESVDSGIDGVTGSSSIRVPATSFAMKRSHSGCLESSNNRSKSTSSINEQTQLLLQKMLVLEKKLQSMESQLKNEQVQRLALETKVVKLEKDNEHLKSNRSNAAQQLQNFAEIFYAETETIKIGTSTNPSPHPSMAELRHRSRTGSLSSNSSLLSRGSRISNIST